MGKKVPLGERVRELREKKGWSQNELADAADLGRAALSRILTGEREVRMVHLIALATALDISLTELIGDTTAANVIEAWVPREQFEQSERTRIEYLHERDVAKAAAEARLVEVLALKKQLELTNSRVDTLEQDVALGRAERAAAAEQRQELLELRGRAQAWKADQARLEAEVATLTRTLGECREQAAASHRQLEYVQALGTEMQADLAKAKNGQLFVGAMGLFLGNAFGGAGKRRG